MLFFLTTAFLAGVPLREEEFEPLFRPPRDLFWDGVAYGGGRRDLAASQSKGIEEESDGVLAGD